MTRNELLARAKQLEERLSNAYIPGKSAILVRLLGYLTNKRFILGEDFESTHYNSFGHKINVRYSDEALTLYLESVEKLLDTKDKIIKENLSMYSKEK